MIKEILFTHNDLDGVGCAVVLSLANSMKNVYHNGFTNGWLTLGNDYLVIHCAINAVDSIVSETLDEYAEKIDPYTEIIFSDICCSKQMMMDLIECGYTISVYDHHASNEWCNDIDGINSFVMERNSYDENESGASVLFWNRYRDILNIPSIIKFVEAVRGYDVFEFDDLHHEGLYLNKMLHMMSIEAFEDYWVAQLNQLSDNQTPKSLNNFYSVHDFYENQLRDEAYLPLFDSVTNLFISSALNAEEKKIEELSNKPGWMFEAGGYRFSVFMSDSSINMSNVAQVYLQKNPDVDVFVFVIINTNGYCGYSFRTSNPEINVSEFAKLFNGGGHPMAAGASIHRDTVEALQKLFTEDLGNKIG